MYEKWLAYDQEIREVIEYKKTMARIKQQNKFKNLRPKVPIKLPKNASVRPKYLKDFVINLSSAVQSEDELRLLKKCSKFIPLPSQPPVEAICLDVMASVRGEDEESKQFVGNNAFRIVNREMKKHTCKRNKRANEIQ